MSKIGPGTLKCILASGDLEAVLAALQEHLEVKDVRRIGAAAAIVHTMIEASELRDRLCAQVGKDQSLLVLEFEKWSGYGAEVHREWLLARGH